MSTTLELCRAAKSATASVAARSDAEINAALSAMAKALTDGADEILAANELDVEAARGVISEVMIDRLRLTRARIEGMAKGILDITRLPSPLGKILGERVREDGLEIKRLAFPSELSP